jgi:mRNA interferase MazF
MGDRRRLGGSLRVRLDRGVIVKLDPTLGHEQRGTRPCVIVSDPDVIADQRFPLVRVVPVTGTSGEGALYPMLRPSSGGLSKVSYALVDHLRSIDKRRVRRVFGTVARSEMDAIDEGLALFLGLAERFDSPSSEQPQ